MSIKIGIATPPKHFDSTIMLMRSAFGEAVDVNQTIIRYNNFAYCPDCFKRGLPKFRTALKDLAECGADGVALIGSPFIYFHPESYDGAKKWHRSIEKELCCPVLIPALAIIRAVQKMEINQVAICGMYFANSWLRTMTTFLESGGLRVCFADTYDIQGLVTEPNSERQAHAPTHPLDLMAKSLRKTRRSARDAEAIVISGLAGPIGRKYSKLESDIGLPILSVENMLLWELNERFGLSIDLSDFGHVAGSMEWH